MYYYAKQQQAEVWSGYLWAGCIYKSLCYVYNMKFNQLNDTSENHKHIPKNFDPLTELSSKPSVINEYR